MLNEQAAHTDMDAYTVQAWKMIPAVRDAFELSKESDKTKEQYGKDAVGSSLLLARRLVEAGSRFVTAAGYHSTSWDTHSDNDKGHRDRLAPPLDRSLSALIDDLQARGLLETTLVMAMGSSAASVHQHQPRPRPLAQPLVARARGRRAQDGDRRRRERRARRERDEPRRYHGRPLRDHLYIDRALLGEQKERLRQEVNIRSGSSE